jgi:cytidine deaminase
LNLGGGHVVTLLPSVRIELLQAADRTALRAHAPYSRFRVGAAVLAEGEIFVGCNVENASSGLAICAERAAIFAAVASGRKRITAVAISFPDLTADAGLCQRMPCGACRQVMTEFAGDDLAIVTEHVADMTLAELLPNGFRLA